MPSVIYAQRYSALQTYDNAIISRLTAGGWTVTPIYGTLTAIDWSEHQLLIIGPPGTNWASHVDSTLLNAYDVDIISMCRYTSTIGLGMAGGAALSSVSYFNRLVLDPRAIFSGVATTASSTHCIYNVTAGTTLIYSNNISATYAGVAERFRDTYSRIHWGYHNLAIASANMLALFDQFADAWTRATIDAVEAADTAAFEVSYIPDGGFDVAIDGAEAGDTLAVEAFFRRVYDATLASTEPGDTLAVSGEFDWSVAVVPVLTHTYFAMEIDDGVLDPVRIPISSWQGTLRLDLSSYLQCVIPAAGPLVEAIAARLPGEFTIYRGARFANGIVYETEMARAPLRTTRRDEGPTNDTITLSGYAKLFSSDTPPPDALTAVRQLTSIRSVSSGDRFRVRCGLDWYLKPGAVAVIGETRQFTVDWINYIVNIDDQWMEVGESG